jgi:hypothetical protein
MIFGKVVLGKFLCSGAGAMETAVDLDALGPEPEVPLSSSILASEPTLEAITKTCRSCAPRSPCSQTKAAGSSVALE